MSISSVQRRVSNPEATRQKGTTGLKKGRVSNSSANDTYEDVSRTCSENSFAVLGQGRTGYWGHREMLVEDGHRCMQGSFFMGGNEALQEEIDGICHVRSLFADWLVLQASHPAFEKDKVVLRCRGKEEEDIMERTYYKNEEKIRSSYNSNITVYPAFNDDSTYHCTASGTSIWWGSWTETSRPLKIQVQGNDYTPMGNRAWQGTSVWDGRGVLSGGDFMSGLF